jgi:hypothetical protein
MSNELWRLDSKYLAAYTEDREIMRKIRRSYPQFKVMAEYQRDGEIFGIQYLIPNNKKRTIRRMLGVNVSA